MELLLAPIGIVAWILVARCAIRDFAAAFKK